MSNNQKEDDSENLMSNSKHTDSKGMDCEKTDCHAEYREQIRENLLHKICAWGSTLSGEAATRSFGKNEACAEDVSDLDYALWQVVVAYQDYPFYTSTGLPFSYKVKRGKNGEYTGELTVSRKTESKTLAKSSLLLAFHIVLFEMKFSHTQSQMNQTQMAREPANQIQTDQTQTNQTQVNYKDNQSPLVMLPHEYKGPKAIGQIFGISYVYSMFWSWGLITVPEKIEKKISRQEL